MIKFNREITNKFEEATTREWFVTNGLGGYAAGTISGVLTRRYHGLLVAALDPPLSRTLMASKIDEIVTCDGEEYILSANIWGDRTADLEGLKFIEEFYLDGTIPTWIYELGGPRLRKQIWMLSGENTTYIRYELDKTTSFLDLRLNAILNLRDHHGLTSTENPMIQLEMTERGVKVSNREGISAYIFSRGAEIELTNQWKQYYLRIEDYRGFDALEYGLQGCTFNTRLRGGESLTVAISIRPDPLLGGNRALDGRKEYERLILDLVDGKNLSSMERQLVLAADQFIVERVSENNPDGKSVIAGFPWFEDWGRDTMIALPGLTLATGRPEVAKQILETFSMAIDKGMLPNRFPEVGEHPEYNTVDATLWYFIAIWSYIEVAQDNEFLKTIFPVLEEIINEHVRGTRYSIKMDPADGLLYSGEEDVQLTWMDVKIGDWVVTPRTGKAVEINALWYNALEIMAEFSDRLGLLSGGYTRMRDQVKWNFYRFWNSKTDMCYDVIDGPEGNDPSLRPNQIMAVSLPFSPLTSVQQKAVVDIVADKLLTRYGLRSLASDDPRYVGLYGGSPRQRDASYHQGIVWGWLIGPFVKAHLRVYQDKTMASGFLQPLIDQMESHGIGSISEIFDGDPPHTPRGCFAQAWSVGEVLSALEAIRKM